ncbi:MAG: cytochrome C oxidase subunit IV family protein [candidate division NC10 bacterium]
MADAHAHAASHAEGGHASVATYLRVAVVLAIITAIEITALYVPGLPNAVLVTVLIVFSIFKFGLVVAFFMHLRYDSKVLTALFVGPLMLACAIILALMALFSAFLLLPRA